MAVDIIKQGSTTSVSGYPQQNEFGIYSGTTYPFRFLWQTSRNTDPGYYTITMTSTVPDEKCDQATMLPTRREMTVYIAKSLDGCVATLTDFNLGTTSFVLNQPVSFTGRKLNSYQDWNHTGTNCEMKGVLNSETYFDSTYTLRIINQSNSQVVAVKTGSLLRNTQPNTPISFSVQWDSARPGRFIANLTIQSTGSGISICSNEGILTSQTLTFNVGNDNDGDGWYDIEGDCNDNNRNINPGVTEICNNGVDDDCNSATSDICVYSVYYCDRDNDGVYSSVSSGTCIAGTSGCPPAGCTFTSGNDCNDNDGSVRSPQRYYRDIDGDGFGNPLVSEIRCPAQGWLLNNSQDCNDALASVNPMAAEVCDNNIDDNCNGLADCNDPACASLLSCTCAITNNGIEICDGLDNDCNGRIDDNLATMPCYNLSSLGLPSLGVCKNLLAECRNGRWLCMFEGSGYEAIETSCDGLDNDCDGEVDEGISRLKKQLGVCSLNTEICADGRFIDSPNNIIPGQEICGNSLDDNCDGSVDEGCRCVIGQTKICGETDIGVCSYGTQTCLGDGTWGQCIGAIGKSQESCNGLDDDCDGIIDNGPPNCCFPIGITDSCANDPDCNGITGVRECINFRWQECRAQCPLLQDIEIISPKSRENIIACNEYDPARIRVEFRSPIEDCRYSLDSKQSGPIKGVDIIYAPIGTSRILRIECGQLMKAVSFNVIHGECLSINPDNDAGSLYSFFEKDLNLSGQDREDTGKTIDGLNHEIDIAYEGDNTIVRHTITPKKNLEDVSMSLYIPKCLSEYLDRIEFDKKDYTIIQDDPLIAWHFVDVKDRIDLSYKVRGKIPEDCLEQIKFLPIARIIGDDLKKEKGFEKFILPVILTFIVMSLVIYFQRFHLHSHTETDYEEEFLLKERKMLLKEVKQNCRTKDQAMNYMREKGETEKTIEWILERF